MTSHAIPQHERGETSYESRHITSHDITRHRTKHDMTSNGIELAIASLELPSSPVVVPCVVSVLM